ncbi:eukaryotic translation initiation factor 4E transporter [Drosophila grimshawi]|uniref:GH23976 n=1 Tax=Drosophila grimshawi TaxID=7222 RepID=B4JZP5_DROGR|nr:eukaryotic translation initiation factor 4E transporter [Drosophila grimshawi]EDV90911.1 GH23976 [Drosophila grimshawi]
MDTTEDNSRYSRVDLLALRYEDSSRRRPSCANRTELQKLNFWKINGLPSNLSNNNSNSCSSYGNKTGLSPERENVSLTSSNGLLSSRRALRNRERAHNYYQRFTAGDQIGEDAQASLASLSGGNLCSASYKSANIDHRSISSSHLMPAFAKRRFVVAIGPNETQSEKANYEDGLGSSAKENTSISCQANADLKNTTRSTLSSPMRRTPAASAEWERSEKHSNFQPDSEQLLALSPTFLSGKQGTNLNVQERRIGSGRLLPRNDNWEYKNKDADSSLANLEKDRPQNGGIVIQQRQRTCSTKHSDRSNDILGDRDRDRDRERDRDRDRRINERSRDPNEGKKNMLSGRRATNRDKFNFGDSTMQNRGKRMNMYQTHDRHEPEWFSAGPTSQHETIDLHGFEDYENDSAADVKPAKEDVNKEFVALTNQIGSPTSRSSSIASLHVIDSSNDSNEMTSSNGPPSKRSNDNPIPKSEVEFNFDAFLNMDPMGNDGEVQGEVKGTSRFSRWFASKEPTCGSELGSYGSSTTLDRQEIPSVKDLEAQMKKVDLRPEYEIINTMRNAQQSTQAEARDNSVTRDTEGFKRLLQQLGSQNHAQPTPSYPLIPNVPVVRSEPRANPHDRHQHMARGPEDDLQQYQQQRHKKNDSLPHRHMDVVPQSPLHSALAPGIHDPNVAGLLSLQSQTRMEIQHLLQGIVRGDVSLEFLEKEISNPNTTAQSREIIGAVLYECSNSNRNAVQQKLNHPNDLNPHNAIKNHQFFNKNVSEDLFCQNTQSPSLSQQHLRHSNSPTPLAFTPTSVLRKMTADKESTPSQNNSAINQQYHQYQQLSTQYPKPTVHNLMNESPVIPAINQLQPRMILGGNYAMQHQHQHQLNPNSPQMSPKLPPQLSQQRSQPNKWPPGNMQALHGAKSFGRPILKGTLSSGSQQMAPVTFSTNNELQQIHQQRLKSMQPTETINSENIHGGGPPPIQNVPYTDGISQMQQHHYMQQQQQQRAHHRHRLFHGDMHRQTNMSMQSSGNMAGGPDSAESTNLMKNNNLGPMNCHRDERLSPTTNQLAQWFSPELLARASAGKLPLLNVNQALSLEEFERSMQHSSATVLN